MSLLPASIPWRVLEASQQPLFFATCGFCVHYVASPSLRLWLLLAALHAFLCVCCYAAWIDTQRNVLVLLQLTGTSVYELVANGSSVVVQSSRGGRFIFAHSRPPPAASAACAFRLEHDAHTATLEHCDGVSMSALAALHCAFGALGALVAHCVKTLTQMPRVAWTRASAWQVLVAVALCFCNVDEYIDATQHSMGLYRSTVNVAVALCIFSFSAHATCAEATLRHALNVSDVHLTCSLALLFATHIIFVEMGGHSFIGSAMAICVVLCAYSLSPLFCCYTRYAFVEQRRFRAIRFIAKQTLQSIS